MAIDPKDGLSQEVASLKTWMVANTFVAVALAGGLGFFIGLLF